MNGQLTTFDIEQIGEDCLENVLFSLRHYHALYVVCVCCLKMSGQLANIASNQKSIFYTDFGLIKRAI